MGSLILFFSGLFTRFLGSNVIKFVAYKIMFLFLIVTILPVVLLKLWYLTKTIILENVMSVLASMMPGGFLESAGMVNITGVGGYIATHLLLVQSISVLVSCAIAGWFLGFIRG